MRFLKQSFDLVVVFTVLFALCIVYVGGLAISTAEAISLDCHGESFGHPHCPRPCEPWVSINEPELECGEQTIQVAGEAKYCRPDCGKIVVEVNGENKLESWDMNDEWVTEEFMVEPGDYHVNARTVMFDCGDLPKCPRKGCKKSEQIETLDFTVEECEEPEPEPEPEPDPDPNPEPTPCPDCRPEDAPRPPDLPTPAEFRGEGGEEEVVEAPKPEVKAAVTEVKKEEEKPLPQTGSWAIFNLFPLVWSYGGYRVLKRIWAKK